MHLQPSATFNDLHGPGDLRDQRAVFNVFKMPVSSSEPHAARAVFQEANLFRLSTAKPKKIRFLKHGSCRRDSIPSFFGPFVPPDISRLSDSGVVWTTHVTRSSCFQPETKIRSPIT